MKLILGRLPAGRQVRQPKPIELEIPGIVLAIQWWAGVKHRFGNTHLHLETIADLYTKFRKRNQIDVPSKNAPCPCGSGVKYKKCCMNKQPEV